MYWIHPDHLGGASILVNSGGKITNWYEYMPYGEMLMELSNQHYNNPYKYNGKEFDAATGYYYYGARYYDPKRSFWLSVDPLTEITGSPYAYVWNDPVNFADPSGMMGERVGGDPDPIVERKIEGVTLKGKRSSWWRRNFGRPIENFFKGSSRNATAGSVPTFSQAPNGIQLNTAGQVIQSFRDSSLPSYGAGTLPTIMSKGIIDGALDLGNFVRNYVGGTVDRSGLGPRMTKWDGNTMSATESEDAKGSAVATAGGYVLGGVASLGISAETTVASRFRILSNEEMGGIWGAGGFKASPVELFEKAGVEYTEHFAVRVAGRANRGITPQKALDAYRNGRMYFNPETRNYIRYDPKTKISVVVDKLENGKAITVFEGNASPTWNPIKYKK